MSRLEGLFAQLNRAALRDPMNQQVDPDGSRPMDSVHPLLAQATAGLGGAMGVSPEATETTRAMQKRTDQILAEAMRSEDPEVIKQAAQAMFQAGRASEGASLMEFAKAAQVKRNATLEAEGANATEEAARKRAKAAKRQAVALAEKRGEHDVADAIDAGTVDPVDYMKAVMEQKNATHSLSDGAILVAEDGKIIARNPKDFDPNSSGGTGSVYGMKSEDEVLDSWRDNNQTVESTRRLLDEITPLKNQWKAGTYATMRDFVTQASGSRSTYERLKTRYKRIRNHQGIAALPKGPASDKDIEIVMSGFPPDNANWEEVTEFLEATERVAKQLADFDRTRYDWMTDGRQGNFLDIWEAKASNITRQEYIDATPKSHVQALMANPTEQMKRDFFAKYKWLPNELQ